MVAAPVLPPLARTRPALDDGDHADAGRRSLRRDPRDPARIDLTPGMPDLTAFPRAAWLRAEAVLDELEPSHFGYGDPRGAPAMRLAVSHWLARNRGIRADPGDLIVVAGVGGRP